VGDFPGQRPNRGFVRAIERGRHAQFVIDPNGYRLEAVINDG
jgi:hypothetical protein